MVVHLVPTRAVSWFWFLVQPTKSIRVSYCRSWFDLYQTKCNIGEMSNKVGPDLVKVSFQMGSSSSSSLGLIWRIEVLPLLTMKLST